MPHNRTPPNRPGPSGPGQSYTPPGPQLWPHRNRPRDKLPRQTRKPTIYKERTDPHDRMDERDPG